MGWIAQAIGTAVAAFAATNLDDILMLMLFFSQVNATFRPRHIVIGQYLGFAVLILASLPGFVGGLLIPAEWIGLLGLLPLLMGLMGLKQGFSSGKDGAAVQGVSGDRPLLPVKHSGWGTIIHPQTYGVAAVTVANGGDNIGLYVPLFASLNLAGLGITLGVFLVLIAMWCRIAEQCARFPAIAHGLSRYNHWLVPVVFIGLGLYILLENHTYRLFDPM